MVLICNITHFQDKMQILNIKIFPLGVPLYANPPSHLPLLQVEVSVVLPGELPDLHQEVPQVVLEARDVLHRMVLLACIGLHWVDVLVLPGALIDAELVVKVFFVTWLRLKSPVTVILI